MSLRTMESVPKLLYYQLEDFTKLYTSAVTENEFNHANICLKFGMLFHKEAKIITIPVLSVFLSLSLGLLVPVCREKKENA